MSSSPGAGTGQGCPEYRGATRVGGDGRVDVVVVVVVVLVDVVGQRRRDQQAVDANPHLPTGGTGVAIVGQDKKPEQQLAAAIFLAFLTQADNTAEFSKSTAPRGLRASLTRLRCRCRAIAVVAWTARGGWRGRGCAGRLPRPWSSR